MRALRRLEKVTALSGALCGCPSLLSLRPSRRGDTKRIHDSRGSRVEGRAVGKGCRPRDLPSGPRPGTGPSHPGTEDWLHQWADRGVSLGPQRPGKAVFCVTGKCRCRRQLLALEGAEAATLRASPVQKKPLAWAWGPAQPPHLPWGGHTGPPTSLTLSKSV